MMRGDDVLMMSPAHRIEVYTGAARRRRWSAQEKAQAIEDSYASSVGEASNRHGVSKSQLFNWRREARVSGSATAFARVEIDDGAATGGQSRAGLIEVELGGASVRVAQGADPRMVTTILMALRSGR
ncbi:MAG TPA: transposase [Phenylobacterium sp.]|jgi:transposase|nr:transposase [Phenylobacterium sp.]